MKYKIKNWEDFQHYKDRNPPWIKLHFSILSSNDWVMLADASRVLALVCMLIASRNEGEIDGSPQGLAYIQRVAYLKSKPKLEPLVDCGFLVPCKQMLADASGCKHSLDQRREEERRDRGETERKQSKLAYLKTDDCLEQLKKDFPSLQEKQITEKMAELTDYCLAKGRTYKDYIAFARNALRKDFGNNGNGQPCKYADYSGEQYRNLEPNQYRACGCHNCLTLAEEKENANV